jgi:hypothetical protein
VRPLLVAAIRDAPGRVRPTKTRWTNAEIAAPKYASVTEGGTAVRGEPSVVDGVELSAELDCGGRVDCAMTADPHTFVLVGIGWGEGVRDLLGRLAVDVEEALALAGCSSCDDVGSDLVASARAAQ